MSMVVIDWGSSSFRAYWLDSNGQILAQTSSDMGVFNLPTKENGFALYLASVLDQWPLSKACPIVMTGMIGSRNGWVETDYLSCPVDALALSVALRPVANTLGHDIYIVPGVSQIDEQGTPDVMRGEESQIVGVMALENLTDGLICLPGTHSKWVQVSNSKINDLTTYMTGELFSLMSKHSSLSSLFANAAIEQNDFIAGIGAAKQHGGLLNQLFGVRARVLTGLLAEQQSYGFLSGLLIGSEFIAALECGFNGTLLLVGDSTLTIYYALAAQQFAIECRQLDVQSVNIAGLHAIAQPLLNPDSQESGIC